MNSYVDAGLIDSTPVTPGYLEEGHGGAVPDGAVLDLGLLGQVVGRVDGRVHPLHGEEGGQVGGVGGDDDEGEEPPDAPHNTRGQGLGHELRTWRVRVGFKGQVKGLGDEG